CSRPHQPSALPLHDALPISLHARPRWSFSGWEAVARRVSGTMTLPPELFLGGLAAGGHYILDRKNEASRRRRPARWHGSIHHRYPGINVLPFISPIRLHLCTP